MSYFIGIDLGTSAIKLLLTDEKGKLLNSVSKEYPLFFPQQGWSEQNPSDWINAVKEGIRELIKGFNSSLILGIGCGGQMHGLVALDENNGVIRPAILWNDGRTEKEVDFFNNVIGKERLSDLTANIAFAGFTAPKLLWMKNNEPENFARIKKIMLPKDYINYYLTGVHSCDYSDASGMLLLDVKNKCWSDEMLDICGICREVMPELFESSDITGTILPHIARELGLPEDVKIVAGAGDNAAAAVGTGTVNNGECNISVGTSGTVFIASDSFGVDKNNALHSFAHAGGKWHLLGCMLSAASCNKWFCEDILSSSDYSSEQADISEDKLGNNRVFFLPYLMGERSPVNDTNARGAFIGLSLDTSRADMTQAVLEGVAFALKSMLEVANGLGIEISRSKLCGGGAKSPLWQKIIANVLGIQIDIPVCEEGPGYGAAMLAMVGCGVYNSVSECAKALTGVKKTISPDPDISRRYEAQYNKFKKIYPSLKELFGELK
ncbi:MAG: xylulokinase [Oscillospiraceae bacterium]|nr:xylulokinase [Oscillospiraceae bacterium]